MIPIEVATRVNEEVNSAITYKSEEIDHWCIPLGEGDCEDFSLLKRDRLIKLGYGDSVHMAVCSLRGGWHAVCIAATTDGDRILDNRFPYPMTKSQVSYKWASMEVNGLWYGILDDESYDPDKFVIGASVAPPKGWVEFCIDSA